MLHLLLHLLGIDGVNTNAYAFWSGIGSDISEFAILGYVINWYHKHKEHMAAHRKHMNAMNEWLRQSQFERTTDEHDPDTNE